MANEMTNKEEKKNFLLLNCLYLAIDIDQICVIQYSKLFQDPKGTW